MTPLTASAAPHRAALSTPTPTPGVAEGGIGVLYNCDTYDSNKPMTRSAALVRAQSWIDARVPYSQAACHTNGYGSYRTDCSGFVSMAWGLLRSYTTAEMYMVSHTIARADLQPGDALNRPNDHVALFLRWADAARTQPVVREQAGPDGAPTREVTWPASKANTYTPIRYNNIQDDTPPAPTTGRFWHNVRWSDGTWSGANVADNNTGIAQVVEAGSPAGDLHVVTLSGGKVHHNVRWANGTWNGANIVDGNGNISRVAAATTPNGDLHVLTVVGGKLYHNVRWADGTWSGAGLADNSGAITDVAAADSPVGDLHVLTVAGGKTYHNVRWANGSWNGANLADGNGSIARVAAATTPNGDLHVLTQASGKLYHNARWSDGSWSGAGLADNSSGITEIAAAGSPAGDLHVLTVAGGKAFHNVRWANGSWNGANVADGNGGILTIGAATTPNGDMHLATIRP
ncbi:hypothetical protein GCM10029976_012420 [Kribbella albertanoniae]